MGPVTSFPEVLQADGGLLNDPQWQRKVFYTQIFLYVLDK